MSSPSGLPNLFVKMIQVFAQRTPCTPREELNHFASILGKRVHPFEIMIMIWKYLAKPNKYVVVVILALSLLPFVRSSLNSFTDESSRLKEGNIYRGEVVTVNRTYTQENPGRGMVTVQDLSVQFDQRVIEVTNDFLPVQAGDKVYVQGNPDDSENSPYVIDVDRKAGLVWLAIIFVLLVVLVAGIKGIYSLIGLIFSFSVIFNFIIPQISAGRDPVSVGLAGAFLVLLTTLYISYGFNRKSLSALAGITVALILVGFTAGFLIKSLHFSGFSTEEAVYLNTASQTTISLTGLVIAGIIIAAIGVLDDVAVTQASTVMRLRSHASSLSNFELFKEAMEIGRDHISAVINTLALAYAGAALPLLLLLTLNNFPVGFTINGEIISEEIVRTIIASIGLVLSVPLTTMIAVWLSGSQSEK